MSCWNCGSADVEVKFLDYQPTTHKDDECSCVTEPCGWAKRGTLTCRACGNVWVDGNIDGADVPLHS